MKNETIDYEHFFFAQMLDIKAYEIIFHFGAPINILITLPLRIHINEIFPNLLQFSMSRDVWFGNIFVFFDKNMKKKKLSFHDMLIVSTLDTTLK